MSEQQGAVWWTELMTREPGRARDYYAEICGWTFEEMDMAGGEGTYIVGKHGERAVIGIFDTSRKPEMQDMPPHWLSYFAVDDVDAATERTRALGGAVHRPPWDIPGVGRIAVVSDPTGAAMGLITPADGQQMAG